MVDSGNNRIQIFAPDGTVRAVWGEQGDGLGELFEPGGVALTPAGELVVADTMNHRIQIFAPLA